MWMNQKNKLCDAGVGISDKSTSKTSFWKINLACLGLYSQLYTTDLLALASTSSSSKHMHVEKNPVEDLGIDTFAILGGSATSISSFTWSICSLDLPSSGNTNIAIRGCSV